MDPQPKDHTRPQKREREWNRDRGRNRDIGRGREFQRTSNDKTSDTRNRNNDRSNQKDHSHRERDRSRERDQTDSVRVDRRELDDIKKHYYGIKPEKKQRKNADKKFNFDWDPSEDTSAQSSHLRRHLPQFFGRGHLGGIDIIEQRREQARYYRELKKQKLEDCHPSDVHWSKKDLNDMTERDWRIFREDYEIVVKGGRVAHPIRNWKECNLPRKISDVIKECGYTEPTPIQRQAIPVGLQNRDIIGVAETGSGKTLALFFHRLSLRHMFAHRRGH